MLTDQPGTCAVKISTQKLMQTYKPCQLTHNWNAKGILLYRNVGKVVRIISLPSKMSHHALPN